MDNLILQGHVLTGILATLIKRTLKKKLNRDVFFDLHKIDVITPRDKDDKLRCTFEFTISKNDLAAIVNSLKED